MCWSEPYKSIGDLAGAYSRRINIQHRLVYQVYDAERTIKVVRMWVHYEWLAVLGRAVHRRCLHNTQTPVAWQSRLGFTFGLDVNCTTDPTAFLGRD